MKCLNTTLEPLFGQYSRSLTMSNDVNTTKDEIYIIAGITIYSTHTYNVLHSFKLRYEKIKIKPRKLHQILLHYLKCLHGI